MKKYFTNTKPLCSLLLGAILATAPLSALSAPDSSRPDAGQLLQGTERSEQKLPDKARNPVAVTDEARLPLTAAGDVKFVVNDVRVTGQDLLPESEINNLIGYLKQQEVTLAGLEQAADRITQRLRALGYIVATAYVPAQEIRDGIVEIAVLMGRYDQIIIKNGTDITNSIIQREMGSVKTGAVIERKSLERAVWLLGDLANTEAKAVLKPGSKTGTSNLEVNLLPRGNRVTGQIAADNFNNFYTRSEEGSITLEIANIGSQGDRLSVRGLSSGVGGLSNGSISWQTPTGEGQKVSVGYSKLNYSLGDIFAANGSHGTANVASIEWKTTFKRSPWNNFYGTIRFEDKELYDFITVGAEKHKKNRLLTVGINGDATDSRGISSYSLTYSTGKLNIITPDARATDDKTARANGTYGKYNISVSRYQQLRDKLTLQVSISGQMATKNLDSSEKMSLGGAYGVRAYPQGEASGDEGYLASAELRWTTPWSKAGNSTWQMGLFVDAGSVNEFKNPYQAGADNTRSLYGAGIGLHWYRGSEWAAHLNYAWKIHGQEDKSAPDRNGRLWLQCVRYF